MTHQIEGLGKILHLYNNYLIDQFGVLHDGVKPYPHAVDSLFQLKNMGKKVVIVSNSGKRSGINIKRMNALGIDESLYDQFVTSGDVAHSYLKNHLVDTTMKRCFLISRDEDTSAIDDLELELTENPGDADLIVISGSESDKYGEQHYSMLLAEAASNETLCLCTNPDKKMLTPDGIRFGAGRIADIYEQLGGNVVWIGKPHESIYNHIFGTLPQARKNTTLCIGDSIEHDVAGGRNFKLSTLLVRTGIVTGMSNAELEAQFDHFEIRPDYCMCELKI